MPANAPKIVPTLGLAVALAALLAACGQSEAPPTAPPPAVEFREVVTEPVAMTFEFVARTRAREDAQVRAQISGTIVERSFEEGQFVEKDSVLFRIDPRPYEASLASAQALMQRAESNLKVAQQNLDRGEELIEDKFISEAEMDKLSGDRDQAVAALEEARASVLTAQINLDFTEVRAPFAGTAGRSNISTGDLVNPTSGTLVSLVQLDPMLVDFDVAENALANRLADNQERAAQGLDPVPFTPRLKLGTDTWYPYDGVIDYADNRVNPTTGTVTITARFPNPDELLYPGQFTRIELRRGEAEMAMLIPQPSVLEDMQGRYVFVVEDDDTVARRNVTLGQQEGVAWVVLDGLDEGDRVIVNGIQKVRSGMTVTATPVAVPLDQAQGG
ncbi:MAG: efflux RND transporter periplasmic adaptor subunit [Pseudomonadota bacterium]